MDHPYSKEALTARRASSWNEMFSSARLRRYAFACILFIIASYVLCSRYVQPYDESEDISSESLDNNSFEGQETYGTNARPAFKDITHVKDLDTQFVPSSGKGRRAGKLVIIGDVHGMKEELVKLLDKIHFDEKKDHLVLAGDMISKGPDSPGVIDLAIELHASAVRGNHEDRVLLAYDDIHSKHIDIPGPAEEPNKRLDTMEEESFSHGDYKDRSVAKSLSKKQVEWLKGLPVILRVGTIDGMGEVTVVHGGLVPGVKLERQDTFYAMNMRTIDLDSHLPSDENEGTPWTKLWNHYQKRLPRNQRSTVVYGHDSKRGLVIKDYSKGLDSGCLKGGKLTALVIEGTDAKVKQHIVQIQCPDGRAQFNRFTQNFDSDGQKQS